MQGVQTMTTVVASRPKRLWAAAIMNILVAAISVVALAYLLLSSNPHIPSGLRPGLFTTLLSLATSAALIVASVLALFGLKFARRFMLIAALIFFGILGYQSLAIIMWGDTPLATELTPRLWTNVIRNALEIGINVWALCSAKTAAFFLDAGSRVALETNTSGG